MSAQTADGTARAARATVESRSSDSGAAGTHPGHAAGSGRRLALEADDYRAIFEHVSEAVLIADQALRIQVVNDAIQKITGYREDELVGRVADNLIHPDDRARMRQFVLNVRSGAERTIERRMLTSAGDTIHAEISGSRLELRGEIYFLGVVRDITERKRAEIELGNSRQRFRDLAELTADWFWETDMDQRFTYMTGSRAFEGANVSAKSAVGKTRYEIHEIVGAGPELPREIARYMARRQPFYGKIFHFNHPEHGETWVELSGRPVFDEHGHAIGYRGAARNRTREILQNRVVRESDARLEAFVEYAPVGVSLKDATNGRILIANETVCRFMEVDREQIIGRTFPEIVPEGDRRIWEDQDQYVAESRRAATFQDELPLPSGRKLLVDAIKFPVFNEEGEVSQIGTITVDMTAQKEIENRLRQVQKMEAIGKLTGGIAHDFNNMLAVIIGCVEEMTVENGVTGDADKYVHAILEASQRGSDLVRRLLAFSSQQPLRTAPVNLNGLLSDLEILVSRSVGEHISVELDLAPEPATVTVDRGQLESCLINLAVNARDAMPAGGTLRIATSTETISVEEASARGDLRSGLYACIAVVDNGHGMPAAVREKAIEPFYTTKEFGSGFGLGLSMVYGFARQIGGGVRIDSREDEGTTVRIYVPVATAAGQSASAAGGSSGAESVRGGDERILVVEDDNLVRANVVRQLRSLGYTVFEAENGAAAVEVVHSENIDLLFTDIIMPGGVLGTQLAEQARTMQPAIRTVLTTGYASGSVVDSTSRETSAAVLSKPYRRADLARTIRDVLDN